MKEKAIVPGVHDRVPPHGRVTLQLTNDSTGKIVKEVKDENAMMDWYMSQVARRSRLLHPGDLIVQSGLSPLGDLQGAATTEFDLFQKYYTPGECPTTISPSYQTYWLWASAANVTPNSAHTHIPVSDAEGAVTAFARLNATYTYDAQNPSRGTVIPDECIQSFDKTRMVVEFGTNQGNGIYRSVGVGRVAQANLAHPAHSGGGYGTPGGILTGFYRDNGGEDTNPEYGLKSLAQNLQQFSSNAPNTTQYLSGDRLNPSAVNASTYILRNATAPDHRVYAVMNNNNIYIFNMQLRTEVAGPTSATITGSGRVSVSSLSTDFWVARGTTLYRCVHPTTDALTVNNTYAPVTGFTDAAILDITNDGTNLYALGDTNVFVINPATGAVTSSWAHSLPRSGPVSTIEYDWCQEILWITYEPDGIITNSVSPLHGVLNIGNAATNFASLPSVRIYGYNIGGGRAPYALVPGSGHHWTGHWNGTENVSTSGTWRQTLYSGLTGINHLNPWSGWLGQFYRSTPSGSGTGMYVVGGYGPSMATHANLGEDVEKDDTQSLKIIYDFDYTDS